MRFCQKAKISLDRFHHDKNEYEDVIIIGADDNGIEQTFDFSSIIEKIDINVYKDATEH